MTPVARPRNDDHLRVRHGSFRQRSVRTTWFPLQFNFYPCTRFRIRGEKFQQRHVARTLLQSVRVEGEIMVHSGKVMLIEDNPDCREIVATMIRLMGYEVTLADDKVPIETADVIVVYLDFPQMRSIRTIRVLRRDERFKDTPIIVFLPWTQKDGTLAALDAGANAVFDGPLKIESLREALVQYAPSMSDHRHRAADDQASTIQERNCAWSKHAQLVSKSTSSKFF